MARCSREVWTDTRLGCCVWAKVGVLCRGEYVSITKAVKPGNFPSLFSLWEPLMQRRELGLLKRPGFCKIIDRRKKWRQHLKLLEASLSPQHPCLSSGCHWTLRIPPRKPSLSVSWCVYTHLRLWLLQNRGCALLFDVTRLPAEGQEHNQH